MATEVTKTIKSAGGDYTSLSAWEAAEQGDLTGVRDEIAIAECYSFADTTAFSIDGWTTDATRYIKIYTPTAERHDGEYNTSKYRFEDTQNFAYIFNIVEDYVRVEGLQLYNKSTGGGGVVRYLGAGELQLSHNIIRADTTSSRAMVFISDSGPGSTAKIWNNVIYDGYVGIYHSFGNAGNTYIIYNNTLVDCLGVGIKFTDSAADVSLYLKNNIVQGAATNYDISSFSTLSTATNISEDATSPDASYRSKVVTFEDEAADDFHLASGDTEARGNATDLSSDADGKLNISDDIDGDSRSAWDIGADEFASAGGGISIPVVAHHLKQQGII